MKKLGFIVFCFIPLCSFSQTKEEYSSVMEKFTRYYNNKQSDSLYQNVFGDTTNFSKVNIFSYSDIKRLHKKLGKIKSYRYVKKYGVDIMKRPMALYDVKFSRKYEGEYFHGVTFSLDEHHKIFGLCFTTSSTEIDSLIKINRQQ